MDKESNRSTPVHPLTKGVDHLKPTDVTGKISGWSTGPPQFAFYRVAKEKEERKHTPQYNKKYRFGVDRWTTPGYAATPSCGFRRSTRSAGGWTTLDHHCEVTL
jgi:hypothetical protein